MLEIMRVIRANPVLWVLMPLSVWSIGMQFSYTSIEDTFLNCLTPFLFTLSYVHTYRGYLRGREMYRRRGFALPDHEYCSWYWEHVGKCFILGHRAGMRYAQRDMR
jgi:hypothetical protein